MADYLKSPVFSSPAYWIALGVGVVGIGAAKFVRPVVKELPLVCASFRNLDGNSVHINSTR